MITIKIIEAKNLPILNNHLRKTIISCFSFSSYRYFYGSFKNKKKTTNPQWNLEFNIDLFRLVDLKFSLSGYRYSKDDFQIGQVEINFINFISSPPGNQIITSMGIPFQLDFPIASCTSPNALLTLSFTLNQQIYPPIQFNPASYIDTVIHIWTTYLPALENRSNPIEIELLQAFYFQKEKSDNLIGIYYNLNKETSWQCIGKSTLKRFFLNQTGLSQVHSLSVSKLSGKYTLFILNVLNYSGKVTLNFIYEKRGKNHVFDNVRYVKPKRKHSKIGVIRTIEINVQPFKKYCVPFFLFYQVNSGSSFSYEFNQFEVDSTKLVFDTSTVPDYSNLSYSEKLSSEIQFNSKIIEDMHSIPHLENVHFLRTNLLPIEESVSLSRLLNDYNLQFQQNSELRIYVGGSTTISTQNGTFHDYWCQGFIVYDKSNGKKCPEMSDLFRTTQFDECNTRFSASYLPTSFKCNFIQSLRLEEIGREKILIYFVFSNLPLSRAYPPGFFLISHLINNKETLLFYNPIVTDVVQSHCALCFRIECIENDWKIIPMKRFFKDKRQMNAFVESIRNSNWTMSDSQTNQPNIIFQDNIPGRNEPENEQFLNYSKSDNFNI